MTRTTKFETTYTRYPFAPLVELGLVIAAWLKRTTKSASESRDSGRHTGIGGDAVGHTS